MYLKIKKKTQELKNQELGLYKEIKMSILEKIDNYLNEEGIDWNGVKKAMVDAAKDIHGKADMSVIDSMIDNVKKKNPKDTEDAVQIGINMMRSGS